MEYTLRPYQIAAVNAGIEFLLRGKPKRNGIVIAPTGSGKALLISNIVAGLDSPALVFQPTKEVLEQNYEKFVAYGYKPSIYSASVGKREIGDITLATIGSIKGRAELFQRFKYIIIDECHFAVSPKGGAYKDFFEALSETRILGLSVGPASIVEFIGGPFWEGFVGTIQDAFNIALESGLQMRTENGLEVIDLSGVSSRGWNGSGFAWKICKRIIRHSGADVPMQTIIAHSNRISLTSDHSVYVAEPGENVRVMRGRTRTTRKRPRVECPPASDICAGSILLSDDGADWEAANERSYDMVEFLSQALPNSRTRAVCDVESIPIPILLPYGRGNHPRSMISRWRKFRSVPLTVYRALGANAPPCELIIVEGSSSTIAPEVFLSDWAYVLGFYLGNGWLCSETRSIGRFGFAVKHACKAKVTAALSGLKGVGWKLRDQEPQASNHGSIEIRANNIFLYELLKHICGALPCYEKYIPGAWITSWPRAARLEMLDGLRDSDGYEQPPNERNRKANSFTTTSPRLADGCLSLLRSLGIGGGKHLRKASAERLGGVINGRQVIGRRDAFSVMWSGHNEAGNHEGHHGARKRFIHDQQCFNEMRVRQNGSSEGQAYVYDLEMEGHPSFVASGFLVHNTATPYRLQTDGYGGSILKFLTRTRPRVFHDVIHYVQNGDLFRDGYLARLQYHEVKGFDRKKLKANSTGADYTDQSVQLHFREIEFPNKIVKVVNRLLEVGRKNVIVFTRFVAESEYLVSQIPGSAMVTAETPKRERESILADFKSGNIKVICNVSVLGIGFDYPELETVVLARPTMSLAVYYQEIGRCVRPHPDKASAWVVDMVGLVEQFGKVEDLTIRTGGKRGEKWYVASGDKPLTNCYFGDRPPVRGEDDD